MPLNKAKYESWLNNPVTKEFFKDIANDLKDITEHKISTVAPMEAVYAQNAQRNKAIDILERIKNWKPEGLENDSDD